MKRAQSPTLEEAMADTFADESFRTSAMKNLSPSNHRPVANYPEPFDVPELPANEYPVDRAIASNID